MQAALTIVGYAVGAAVGGPVGGQVGAALGGYLGGVLAAPDQQGPRIAETAMQSSSYGVGIAKTWGTDRIAGSVIWAAPMQEHAHEESGKGGPTVTTFSYTRSFAVLIGEGPIGGIRRIWADTKLVVDYRDGDAFDAQLGSAQFAAYMTLYRGTEDQMPDPTIESIEGAGSVEPYRGRAYMVFTDLPLASYGNRIPQFSFEISPEQAVSGSAVVREPLVVYAWTNVDGPPRQLYDGPMDYFGTEGGGAHGTFTAAAAAQAAFISGGASDAYDVNSAESVRDTGGFKTSITRQVASFEGGATLEDEPEYVYALVADMDPPVPWTPIYAPSSFASTLSIPLATVVFFRDSGNPGVPYEHLGYRVESPLASPPPPAPFMAYNYASGSIGGGQSSLMWGNPVLEVGGKRVPTHRSKSCYPGDPCEAAEGMAELPGESGYCLACDGEITPNYDWDIISGTAKQLCAIEYRGGALYQQALGPVLLPADPDYNNAAFWAAERAAAITAGLMESDVTYPVVVSSYAEGTPQASITVSAGTADLADIVLDICVEAGLEAGQVDVSDLAGEEVLGYTRARRMPARSVIEPLRSAYFFDAVESGDVIRFVRRGGAPVATITADDLSAGVDDATADLVVTERGQEAELPRLVAVAYKAISADYQTGTQQSRRRVGGTEQQAGTELALVLTDDHAAQIAEVLLYDSWIARNKRSISLWRKWSHLEPTDVITVDDGEFAYRLRVTDKSEQQGVIELELRDDDVAVYEPAAVGAPVSGGGMEVRVDGPTRYELLDIPLLRDVDDSASMYVAARGYRADWRGGILYRSIDEGASYAPFQELARTAVIGHATTALGDYSGGDTIDELNSVTVTLIGGGTLESITTAALLNNGNAAVLGDEIICFKRATLVSERTYQLSGLLRGCLGTEQHMATHEDDDRFVLLEAATLYRPTFELSRVDVELLYKAVSFGMADTAEGEPFTNTAVALKPLSPVHLTVTPMPGGGHAVSWVRRTRLSGGGIRLGLEAPLGEASEAYRVRVLDGDDVIEEQTVSSPEAEIGAGSPSPDYSGLVVEVRQISDLVGVGFPATVDID